VNSSFDISLITANRFEKADSLDLYILPDEKVSLENVELNTLSWKLELKYHPAIIEGYTGTVYKCGINLSDSALSPGVFFQFLFKFNNRNALKSIIKIFGIYKSKGKVLGYINPKIKNRAIQEADYLAVPVKFYNVQKVSGKAMQFTNNAYLDFSLPEINSESLLTEFWIKLNDPEEEILNIRNKVLPDFHYSISTNSFQILSADSKSGFQIFSNPCFVSLKSWYHISILFSIRNSVVSFYCDGSLIAKYRMNSLIEAKDLSFQFYNFEEKESFQIDLLRVIDLNNSINYSFDNKNFQSFTADSSTVLAQFKIDKLDVLTSYKKIMDINSSGIELVKSDAPIFAKAPELNIRILSNSYELEWTGGDYKQADHYELEKSSGNSGYFSVYKIDADDQNEKNYTFLDQKEENSDIVYYRIKQVDKDGSTVYSSQVKVGQGPIEPFTLEQNFPNPFNPKTSIVFDLLEDAEVKVIVYNLEGKEIIKLHEGFMEKGPHKLTFDATDLPSGVYLYKVETPEFSQTKKMVLTK
jgi:hypothetical protein